MIVEVPEIAYGVAGLRLGRAFVSGGGPRLAPMLHNGAPLASLPVYRSVVLKNPGSRINDEWAFMVSPDGQVEINPRCRMLAAIGRASPTTISDEFFTLEKPDARYAELGADLVRSWLATFTTEVIQ